MDGERPLRKTRVINNYLLHCTGMPHGTEIRKCSNDIVTYFVFHFITLP